MDYIAESIALPSGFRIEVVSDDDFQSPCGEWDMVGTMVLTSHCGYNFGHKTASNDELAAINNDPNNLVIPVYMYDHSGITINTTGFSCPWDSGQVGIMYCTKKKAVYEFGKKICTKKVVEKALRAMIGEVKSVDDVLTGNVWGFIVYDPEGEAVDSCWGFVGDSKYCLEEGLSMVKYYEKQASKEHIEAAYWAAREVVTEVRA